MSPITLEERLKRATVKTIAARFDSKCPGCARAVTSGDPIATPQNAPNGSRGVWYCPPCADDFAALYAHGLGSGIPFISEAAIEASFVRMAPYHASLEERRRAVIAKAEGGS